MLTGRLHGSNSVFLLLFLIAALVTALSGQNNQEAKAAPLHVNSQNDALTRSGFEHQYQLDYDNAIHDFELTQQSHPDDPFAANHLLTAIFFRELYRNGALDTGLYSNNSFLNRKRIYPDSKNAARIQELEQIALKLADAEIKANPKDADAYYAHGVTRGMQSTYTALVEKSWFAALGSAKDARHDHEKVLEINPNYNNAKLVVGMHSYIVGSLPWAVRLLAHIVGESGNKTTGIRQLYEAANGGGEAGVDAKTVLALFLRREQRYDHDGGFATAGVEDRLHAAHIDQSICDQEKDAGDRRERQIRGKRRNHQHDADEED